MLWRLNPNAGFPLMLINFDNFLKTIMLRKVIELVINYIIYFKTNTTTV